MKSRFLAICAALAVAIGAFALSPNTAAAAANAPAGIVANAASAAGPQATDAGYRGRHQRSGRHHWRGGRHYYPRRHWRQRHHSHRNCWQARYMWTPYGYVVRNVWVCR